MFLIEGESDQIYIDKIIKRYVNKKLLREEIKLEYIYLNGKGNYNSKNIKNKIEKVKKKYNEKSVSIIYCIDLDNYKSNITDFNLNNKIVQYTETNNYELVKFNKKIEEVLSVEIKNIKEKVKIAAKFKCNEEKFKNLKVLNPENRKESNLLVILDKLLNSLK